MLLSDFRLTPPAPVAAPGVLFCCVLEQKNSSRAAAARGELAVAPRDIGTGARGVRRAARTLRQGDQEMIFTQLVHGRSAAAKPSLLVLPEEYYCPGVSAWSGKAALPYVWSTSFGEYPCYAVHGHEIAANASERNAALGRSS